MTGGVTSASRSAKFGVVVLKASIPNGTGGQSAMCISQLCYIYMKLIWCNGFPEIYARLEEGVGSICHRYMCTVLYIYMKLMWCNGFPKIYAGLEEGGWVNLPWVYVHSAIYETDLV